MNRNLLKNTVLLVLSTLLISNCGGGSNDDDLDLSSFRRTIKENSQNLDKNNKSKPEKKDVEVKLIPLDKKIDVSNSMKFGKKDPFSSFDNETSKLISDFKLKGFISLKNNNYALVEFKDQEGLIDIDSVGDINTKLLPPKAYVVNILPTQKKINLMIEGENYPIILTLD